METPIEKPALEIAPIPKKTVELFNLYFGDGENKYLKKEQRAIERTIESREEVILRELIDGPKDQGLTPTIPRQTRLYSVSIAEKTCYVNFSKEFVTNFQGDEEGEVTAVYSIVNSLTELDAIDKVQILVEGERLEIYQKNLSLKEPFVRNEKIFKGPFPTPIEVVREYLALIESEEYRYAYNLIYHPSEYSLDYSIYFRYMREEKGRTAKFDIISYTIVPGDNRNGVIYLDYMERYKDGTYVERKGVEFPYYNELGEWKLMFKEI